MENSPKVGTPVADPPAPEAGTAYWAEPASSLISQLGSSARGLSSPEAARRLRQEGPNTLALESHTAALALAIRQFSSPVVLILLGAALVSMVLREWVEATIIFAILLASAILSFLQEFQADRAMGALRRRLALTVRVRRDAGVVTVPAAEVVRGDIVLLSAGTLVPADGLVLESQDCLVSESSLTGESYPIEKRPGTVDARSPVAARSNCVWMGTSVRSGTATVLIVETGQRTEFGVVATSLAAHPQESAFTLGIHRFGSLLMRIMLVIVVLVIVINQILGRPALDSLLFAVALSVGLTPEMLPAIVSVTLSRGARAMARQGVIVRRLDAIEDLGGMDLLCTDKTGTLTEGKIALHSAVDLEGLPAPAVLRLAFLNAALEAGIANPLDEAIVTAGRAAGCNLDGARKVAEIPYDFSRKRLTLVVQQDGEDGPLIVTKGAFSNVLAVCDVAPLARQRCQQYYEKVSDQGLRLLAVATRRAPSCESYGQEIERGLTLVGFLLFQDPPRADVPVTLRALGQLGIRTCVISGDNRYIVAHLARVVGLNAKAMLTGEQLAGLKDEALWALAPRTDLFVEVDPQQKERIVRALQRTGHTVGYLGDGINDAPALHAADVGISVDRAVDVARDSADIVLLQRDLRVLRRGVEAGRRTFVNTLKYICITISANFGNMVSMAIATPLLPFLPLTAAQILLNNFLSDLPSLALATDKVSLAQLHAPQRWDLVEVRHFMIIFGLLSTMFDLLAFAVLLHVFDANESEFQTAWFVISLLTELAVVLVLRTREAAWRSLASPALLWTTAASAVTAVALPFCGGLAQLLNFEPLPGSLLLVSLTIVAGYVVAAEGVKRAFFRQRPA